MADVIRLRGMSLAVFFATCCSGFLMQGHTFYCDRGRLNADAQGGEQEAGPRTDVARMTAAGTAASGLVAAATTAVTTATTTACASGACAVGAAAASGGAATAAASIAGGQVAAALGAMGLTSLAVFAGSPGDLTSMKASSVELSAAVANGKPSVLEFYSVNCPHCNQAAKQLYQVERRHPDVNWVMVDTDQESNRLLWESLGVSEIPHFAFLDAEENLRATAIGLIDSSVAEHGISLALADRAPPTLSE